MFPIGTSVPPARRPVVVWLLLALNVVAFVHQLGLDPAALRTLVFTWGVVPERMWTALAELPWRLDAWLLPLFASQFLHGSLLHLLGNLLFLYTFGPAAESRFGHRRFVVFYLACGVVAALAQAAMAPSSAVPMIGASGAIAGVLGAFLILHPRAVVLVLVPILFIPFTFTLPALFFLVFWFAQQLLFAAAEATSPVAGGGVAWWAHIGGFVAGALGVLFARRKLRETRQLAAAQVVEVLGADGRQRRYRVERHPSRYGLPVPRRRQR